MPHLWTPASVKRNAVTRAMEPVQPFFLLALAKRLECTVFLDVGANVGAYALLFSDTMPVHAFEPAPEAFKELATNVELNDLSGKITAHQVAASNINGQVAFGLVDGLSGRNSIADTSIHASFNSKIEVRVAPIDDLLPLSEERVCIKLDIEGHEPEAIAGMARLLETNTVLLQVEEWGAHRLPNLLGGHGLTEFSRIGHDCYFTNAECSPALITSAFEEAAEMLIESNSAAPPEILDRTIRRRVGDIELSIHGKSAALVRRLKKLG
jgi:FkbM family methyltransferase